MERRETNVRSVIVVGREAVEGGDGVISESPDSGSANEFCRGAGTECGWYERSRSE